MLCHMPRLRLTVSEPLCLVQNISLTVNLDSEIRACKEQLIRKVALLDAVSAQNAITTAATASAATNHGAGTPPAIDTFGCVFWMALLNLFHTKLRASDLCFLHHGKPLDDDGLWLDYVFAGKNNNNQHRTTTQMTTVTVHPRLRGGCFMVSASVLAMLCAAVVGSSCTCGVSLVAVPFLLPLLFVLPFFCL